MALRRGRPTSYPSVILQGSVIPTGTIQPFGGTTVPSGWLLCDGSEISRTTYSALFAVLSTSNGAGNGTTTFNLPDMQGKFFRGKVQIDTATGTGSAASNNATFTSHGIKRTGFKVRVTSGTLSGLTTSTDYYAIVIDTNTLAFATTLANAIAGTKIVISGANSAILTQYEDPDASTRIAPVSGGSATSLGSIQGDAFQNFSGSLTSYVRADGGGTITRWRTASGPFALQGTSTQNTLINGTIGGVSGSYGVDFDPSTVARTANETRPNNAYTNYIIKV